MRKFGLNAFLICLIVSCASAFDWTAKPYAGDSKASQIVNEHGETVKCNQPTFDDYTCFASDNIAELKAAIVKLERRCNEGD